MPIAPRRPALSVALTAAFLFILLPAISSAQYFGQNKVQYDEFDFEVLETEHFDIYYYPREAEAARMAAPMAERWYARLSSLLGHQLSSRQPVFFYASHPEFEQTNVIEGMISESVGGVTEGGRRRVVLPFGATLGETDHVLGHELVHAFQYDILGENIGRAPLWFIEGMAEYLSVGPRHAQTAMWLRDAALEGRVPRIVDLSNPNFFPYRFGHALWAYIGGRWGDAAVASILVRLAPGSGGLDAIRAIELTTKMEHAQLSAEWHASIYQMYDIAPRDPEADPGEDRQLPPALLAERNGSGAVNVGPSLSPDGSRVAFLSERSRLSIDLHVADTETGERVRRLTTTAVDPHFESLQFLASAGSWAPDNRRLAVGSVQRGRGTLAIFNTDNGDVIRNIPLDEPGEILQPAWSPDGETIAYVAQIGGFTDLYLHTLATGETRRLTDDAFADLQPAWSPDGRQIAFVTDRFSSRVDAFSYAHVDLAVMDVATAAVRRVETGLDGLATSPQWTSDASALVFVSEHTGRPDIYRVPVEGGRAVALTAEPTGVAGITPLSPALSVARSTGHMAYSVFVAGAYEVRLEPERDTPPASLTSPDTDLARLPPSRESSDVARALADTTTGLAAAKGPSTRPYTSGLSLVDIGQSVGGSFGGNFGTYVSGGIWMLFSDMLGNHLVPLTLGVNGEVRDIAAQTGYINRTSRWNWGVSVEHVPLRSGYVEADLDVIDGLPVYLERAEIWRETTSQVAAFVAYPFSRSTRIEFGTSLRRIGFSRERETFFYDAVTGRFLGRQEEDLGNLPALALADASAALVGDRTAFGAVGPVLGQRYRFEVAPTFGDLRMTAVTLDLRRYFMPWRPVTIAMRGLHAGRYGSGGEDERLFPLSIGYSTLVRGYDAYSFDASECTFASNSSCPEFDRLQGSRIAVFNGEVRIPVGGLFTGNLDYGPIPTEVFGFYDAGVAWTRDERPTLGNGTRSWVSSAGLGARVNVFGYMIAEFNLARPIDRPSQGWMFVFNMRPSF